MELLPTCEFMKMWQTLKAPPRLVSGKDMDEL